MLSRLLNKLFCCPDKKLRPWQREAEKRGSSGRDGGMAERERGRVEVDQERWLVGTMEAGGGKECEMSSGLHSPERLLCWLWLTDPEPGCTL